jgi:hypothetical protein
MSISLTISLFLLSHFGEKGSEENEERVITQIINVEEMNILIPPPLSHILIHLSLEIITR